MAEFEVPKHVKKFVFDGCHKIYLIENDAQEKEMRMIGYTDKDILPIQALRKTYDKSCPLKFINWADLHDPEPVPQCEEWEV